MTSAQPRLILSRIFAGRELVRHSWKTVCPYTKTEPIFVLNLSAAISLFLTRLCAMPVTCRKQILFPIDQASEHDILSPSMPHTDDDPRTEISTRIIDFVREIGLDVRI